MRICLAGGIKKQYITTLKQYAERQPVNILQTYWDYQGKKTGDKFDRLHNLADFFMLDSGGFTLLYNKERSARNNVTLEQYTENYIEFIKSKGVQNYIELDLYDAVGIKETEKLRAKLERETGRISIPVFQRSTGLDYYKGLTKDYPFIAIGGIAVGRMGGYPIQVLQKMLDIARQNNCKVHGLGFTSQKYLPTTKWFSVDSTSWLSPVRFGGKMDAFNGQRIVKINMPPNRRMKTEAIAQHQIEQWLKFMDYARKY